jgi:hypothetical protein
VHRWEESLGLCLPRLGHVLGCCCFSLFPPFELALSSAVIALIAVHLLLSHLTPRIHMQNGRLRSPASPAQTLDDLTSTFMLRKEV